MIRLGHTPAPIYHYHDITIDIMLLLTIWSLFLSGRRLIVWFICWEYTSLNHSLFKVYSSNHYKHIYIYIYFYDGGGLMSTQKIGWIHRGCNGSPVSIQLIRIFFLSKKRHLHIRHGTDAKSDQARRQHTHTHTHTLSAHLGRGDGTAWRISKATYWTTRSQY